MKNILLHVCCGPCALVPVLRLREQDLDVVGLFYNPNIHDAAEYLRRREAVQAVAVRLALEVQDLDAEYDPKLFFQAVVHREDNRCSECYRLRLERTFAHARQHGFQAVTTTLLYSRYQNHEAIQVQGQKLQKQTGIRFYGQDFRPGWREGIDLSKEWRLYRQSYCGCLYSKLERRKNSKKAFQHPT
jgi:predicted adenine nucleotide alpha hydrolase (AANH) superfamily ATPase